MTLENTLRQQLSDMPPGGFHLTINDWNVTLATDRHDSLSCALKELTLDKAAPIAEDLRPWAERIADRATGLLEPLRLIEVDTPIGKALLRSETPTLKDGKAYYYELLLTRGDRTSATLHRYVGQVGEKRDAVPFVLTHDAIVKLATDIVGRN
jgi:hypothetical protein